VRRTSREVSSFQALAVIDEAAWQRPTQRRISPLDQDDGVADFDDDIDGQQRVARGFGHGFCPPKRRGLMGSGNAIDPVRSG